MIDNLKKTYKISYCYLIINKKFSACLPTTKETKTPPVITLLVHDTTEWTNTKIFAVKIYDHQEERVGN